MLKVVGVLVVVYLSLGVWVAVSGPIGRNIRDTVRGLSRPSLARRLQGLPEPDPWRLMAMRAVLTLAGATLWPIFLPGLLASERKQESPGPEAAFPRGLRFAEMGGGGQLRCRDCGHHQEVVCHIHGFGESEDGWVCTSAGQCDRCGAIQEIEIFLDQPVDHSCACGGTLRNEADVFCPVCRSSRVDYHLEWIT